MTDKKYKKITDLFKEGKHLIKVKPHPVFNDDGQPVENSHKTGESKWGKWYMYDTKVKGEWISIFANDRNKEGFEKGFIVVNLKPKKQKGVDGYIYDEDGNKLLVASYIPLSDVEVEQAKTKWEKKYGGEETKGEETKEEDDINLDDLPF